MRGSVSAELWQCDSVMLDGWVAVDMPPKGGLDVPAFLTLEVIYAVVQEVSGHKGIIGRPEGWAMNELDPSHCT